MGADDIRKHDSVLEDFRFFVERRGYAGKTINEYSGTLRRLAAYFDRCPSKLTLEQVREYQLHLAKLSAEQGTGGGQSTLW